MKKPSVIHWMITSQCNLNCPHCFSFKRKDLNLAKNLIIADKIIDLRVKKVVISGGEPLVMPGILEIIGYLKKNNLVVRLDTNGLLLPKFINQLVKLQLDTIGISLDGSTPQIDQKMRLHKNHFQSVIKSLEKLKKTKTKVIIHTLATKINYNDIPEIANLLQKYPIESWVIFEYCPYGLAYINRRKFQLKKGEFEKLKKSISYKGKVNFCQIKDRVKAYYFINSDGSIYTQPLKFGFNYPVYGNILKDDPAKFFNIINNKNNLKRSKLVK